jgi:hypothetical protein
MGAMFEYTVQGRGQSFPYDFNAMPSAFAADPRIGDRDACKG